MSSPPAQDRAMEPPSRDTLQRKLTSAKETVKLLREAEKEEELLRRAYRCIHAEPPTKKMRRLKMHMRDMINEVEAGLTKDMKTIERLLVRFAS